MAAFTSYKLKKNDENETIQKGSEVLNFILLIVYKSPKTVED